VLLDLVGRRVALRQEAVADLQTFAASSGAAAASATGK
jgi:hypothetical protein